MSVYLRYNCECRMAVCTVWLVIIYFILSLQSVNTSVNTCLDPKITTIQSSDLPQTGYGSDEAVDGCTTQTHGSGCCSHTEIDPSPNEAWWQINLGDQVVIEYIQIYYRDETPEQKPRFAGYQIYLSNTSSWRNVDSCYTDTTPTQSLVDLTPRITSCTSITRYLTIYADRQTKPLPYQWYSTSAILELCEVQIYGCPVGKYGNGNCDNNCDTSCVDSLCHPNSGQCEYCATGFYKYGLVCTLCPTNCLRNVCNVESGACSACSDGYHGSQCDQPCPVNCQSGKCDQYSGVCTACADGYRGGQCDQLCTVNCQNRICDQQSGVCTACINGYHGSHCDQSCPDNCKDMVCDQYSRACAYCASGYQGVTCDQQCPDKCKDRECYKENGLCKECEKGFHGIECQQRCPIYCKDECSQFGGRCEECVAGYHSFQCDANCPSNCKDTVCNQTNGWCLGCEEGYHGNDCSLSCPDNCKDRTCTQDNGQCIECVPGFHGRKCFERCSYCQDGRCDKDTGYCMTPCIDGLTGDRCDIKVITLACKEGDFKAAAAGTGVGSGVVIVVLVIVIIVMARTLRSGRQRDTTRSTTMTDISLQIIGQETRTETDYINNDVSDVQRREQNTMNVHLTDDTYIHL